MTRNSDSTPHAVKRTMGLRSNRLRIFLLVSALLGMAVAASPVVHAATLTVVNNDGPGEGFNDPAPRAPVGGNTGTTLGAQRLNAFQRAADIWGGLISSSVTIRVGAQFNPLECDATSAILGSAGPTNVFRDFPGALVAGTYYPVALANALRGSDLNVGNDDINATFNSSIGTTCAFPKTWYYGLDANPSSSQTDFVTIIVHELAHGLGFTSLVNRASGAKFMGFNDTFMRNLEHHGATPSDYPSMTNAQRVAASTATGNLHWVGANVRAASGVLTTGKVGDHVRMYAPNPQEPGSSVSHWDTVLTPHQIMEHLYTVPHHNPVLELPLFQDIGWTLLAPPPPGTHTLTVSKSGNGSGTVTSNPAGIVCGAVCSASYASSASVSLTATPVAGNTFAGWSNTCSGTGACTVAMNSDISVTAAFALADDGFPSGGAIPAGWIQPSGSNASWVVTNDAAYAGSLSLKSGIIGNSQKSEISYTANFPAGNVSFALKVSSEPEFDFLEFYIDGVLKNSWSGQLDWALVSFPISAGTHTLLWRYVKDESVSLGSDAAWIDSVVLPAAPGAPTGVSATPGNASATVSFSAPSNTGGTVITSYTVTSNPGGITAAGTASPITVPGLTNGTAYTFTVTATNSLGTGIASAASNSVTPAAPVTVPGAPTGVSATPGNASATVSFSAPSNTGGTVITSYTVTSNPGGITATGTGSPITVPGLTNGTAYTFTVTATNSLGTGIASAASNSVTPAAPVTVPGAPTIGTAVAGNANATVSFTAPASNGGAVITSYTVTSSPGGITGLGIGSPITVTGLSNGTAYTFTVMATNSAGTSAPSAASNSVTPAQTNTIAYYRFENGAANTQALGSGSVMDTASPPQDGSPSGSSGPTYRSDVPANPVPLVGASNNLSLQFTGNDAVLINTAFPFNVLPDATLEFWLKFTPTAHQSVFWTRGDSTDTNRYSFFVNANGTFGFDYKDPNGNLHALVGLCCSTGVNIPPDTWTHLAIVKRANVYTVYGNGVLVASATDTSPNPPTSTQWMMSGRSGEGYQGFIDEVRISDKALEPSQFLNNIIYSTGTASGGNSSLSLLANFNIASADAGRTGNFYIAALLATGELFLLTPSGFIQYTGGPIPTFSTDILSNRSITVLSGVNVTPFLGTILFAGYGINDADLIGNSKYNAIYTVQ